MDGKNTGKQTPRQRVLVADDSLMNCMLLEEMLADAFDVTMVENGREAVNVLADSTIDIALLLLDLNMPEMDGFEVLDYMNKYNWIEDVPVIIISAETGSDAIQRAYDMGVSDFISRPFDAAIVRRRVENSLLLSARQRRLTDLVTEQIYEKEKNSQLMISILSHIVEFRNGESGMHVMHINAITELLLRQLQQGGNPYGLTGEDIGRITMASALHDIGKISIPDEIINKPGRLTDEEFAIMKTHSMVGAQMLDALPREQRDDPLTVTAYEICRWHHERYDGRGYPDGLKGDDIPIAAQIVALADVYDALTSERCYKKAFAHDTAVQMIVDGQCGVFNPRLLDCLRAVAGSLPDAVNDSMARSREQAEDRNISEQLKNYDLSHAERRLQQLEFERRRFQLLADSSRDALFTYVASPPSISCNGQGAEWLGIDKRVADPLKNEAFLSHFQPEDIETLKKALAAADPAKPDFEITMTIKGRRETRLCRCTVSTLWAGGGETYTGFVGRVFPLEQK